MYLVRLVLLIFLPQSPKCCDYGNEPWPLNEQLIALVAEKEMVLSSRSVDYRRPFCKYLSPLNKRNLFFWGTGFSLCSPSYPGTLYPWLALNSKFHLASASPVLGVPPLPSRTFSN